MRYVVRTVPDSPEREQVVTRLRERLPGLQVLVDHDRDAYASFRRACEMVADTGGILLEDDVELCSDFLEQTRAVFAQVGFLHVINFFERPKSLFPAGFVGGSSFMWTQCTYLPPGFAGRIFDYYDEFHRERPKKAAGMAYDLLLSYALVRERRRYYRHRPCLVQHLPLPSVIGPRPANRQSPYYIELLRQQGVRYEDLLPG